MCGQDLRGNDALSPVSTTRTDPKHRWWGTITVVKRSLRFVEFDFQLGANSSLTYLFHRYLQSSPLEIETDEERKRVHLHTS